MRQSPSKTPRDERPMFVTWGDEQGKKAAFGEFAKALAHVEPIQRSTALNTYQNIASPQTSIRDSFDRGDYEDFRPGETLPKLPKDKIKVCMKVYEEEGIIKNIVDMMADFTAQGIDVTHRSASIEKVHKEWMKKVKMAERSERFVNMLLRSANTIIRRRTAKLKAENKSGLMREFDVDPADVELDTKDADIPWSYTIYNPQSIDVVGEEVAQFLGSEHYVYSLRLSEALIKKIRANDKGIIGALADQLPPEVIESIKLGSKSLVLDKDKTSGYYYKKDDDQVWATPLIYSVLKDIYQLNKMKKADMAALDGAISHIRIWKLGNIEAKIYPTQAGVERLASMLLNNVGGGSIDLIWGPELELEETSTDVYKFLGAAKYEPVLSAIYQGLGIPPTLTGGQVGGGLTNNAISLKTLIQRLVYCRMLLTEFWEKELRAFQKAMGFRYPAELVFERMTLTDESSEKALWIQLADRGLISMESILERFDGLPEIEAIRIKREDAARERGDLPKRAGPWNNPEPEKDLKKIALQTGVATPSEVGLELEKKKPNEISLIEHQAKIEKSKPKPGLPIKKKKTGVPQSGRPKNSNDKTKRKKKVVKPRVAKALLDHINLARAHQKEIATIINPIYLKSKSKANMRQLTENEGAELEKLKFALLCNVPSEENLTKAALKTKLAHPLSLPGAITSLLTETVAQFKQKCGREPTLDEIRDFQAGAVALYRMPEDVDADDTDYDSQ